MICSATSEMLSDFYRHKIPNLWCTVCSEPSYFSLKAAFKFLLAYAVACQQMYCTVDVRTEILFLDAIAIKIHS